MNNITEDKIRIKENLEYLGLDLKNIPDFLKNYRPLEYMPIRGFGENKSRIYKYLDVRDIQIYISTKNRMDLLTKRFEESSSLYSYMKLEDDEDIVKHSMFLKMLDQMDINKIDEFEKEQELLEKKVPFEVKYSENYLWQIYYSSISDQYFMMETLETEESETMFFLLKKQIEAFKENKPIYIYVPICNMEYSGNFLTRNEMLDMENYIWLFTGDWPFIYEVYDKNNNMAIHIFGKTKVYDNMSSYYQVILNTEKEANSFFKLIKALFVLQTETEKQYEFFPRITANGELEFLYNSNSEKNIDKKMSNKIAKTKEDQYLHMKYEELPEFIKKEFYIMDSKIDEIVANLNKISRKKEDLSEEEESKLDEFQNKENYIASFLNCRDSFLGRIRFFMKSKKINKKLSMHKAKNGSDLDSNDESTKNKKKYKEYIKKDNGVDRDKNFFTIEDLVLITSAYQTQDKLLKSEEMDVRALENKIQIMNAKIENAEKYINEISSHNRSIFDFWKFTNKGDNLELGTVEKSEKPTDPKLDRVFNYMEDFEDLGSKADKIIREEINKNESDSIFLATTDLLEILNYLRFKNDHLNQDDMKYLEDKLEKIKQDSTVLGNLSNYDDYDIFGGVEDRTKIRVLAGKKHREIAKNEYRVLDISKNMDINKFKEKLQNVLKDLNNALTKLKSPISLSLYTTKENIENDKYALYHIKPEEAVKEIKGNSGTLYRIDIKKGEPAIFLTNTIYYSNYNKTLPFGMELNDEVLIDNSAYDFKNKKEEFFRVNREVTEFNYETIDINLKEFSAKSLVKSKDSVKNEK